MCGSVCADQEPKSVTRGLSLGGADVIELEEGKYKVHGHETNPRNENVWEVSKFKMALFDGGIMKGKITFEDQGYGEYKGKAYGTWDDNGVEYTYDWFGTDYTAEFYYNDEDHDGKVEDDEHFEGQSYNPEWGPDYNYILSYKLDKVDSFSSSDVSED